MEIEDILYPSLKLENGYMQVSLLFKCHEMRRTLKKNCISFKFLPKTETLIFHSGDYVVVVVFFGSSIHVIITIRSHFPLVPVQLIPNCTLVYNCTPTSVHVQTSHSNNVSEEWQASLIYFYVDCWTSRPSTIM